MQCCNVARISVARDAARPKNSHLVGPPRGAETRPNLRVPVFGANFGLFGPPTAQGVVFRCVAWRLGAICPAHGGLMFLAAMSPQPAAPSPRRGGLLLLLRQQLLGRRRSGAGSSSGRYGSAMAPCSLPARAIPCVWRRGAAQRAPRARCAAAFCAAHPRSHDWRAGEEVCWAELWHWSTGGISPPQLCLAMLAECLRGPRSDRLRARPLRPPRQVHRRRSLRAHHVR